MNISKIVVLALFALTTIVGCQPPEDVLPANGEFGIFSIVDDGEAALLNGTINARSLTNFNTMIGAFPNIKTLQFGNAPGSEDDETNVQLARALYAKQLNTHINEGGEIASGAVDLFLAGRTRTRASENVKVGVHSWSDGNQQATDLSMDAPEHDLYINYYKAVGFDDQWARDFYFFTINAAAAKDIHWMTESELTQYGVFN